MKLLKICQLLMALLIVSLAVQGQDAPRLRLTEDVAASPANARFVYRDLENFNSAFRQIESGSDPTETLTRVYFGEATPGLRIFVEKYDLTADRLIAAMDKHPEAYGQIESKLLALRAQETSYRKTYQSMAGLIPEATFPPTYFLVGAHRGIGSGSVEGPLISIEKDSIESIESDVAATLAHEMVHMQQLAALNEDYFSIFSGEQKTLLALSIREGVATYLSELLTGGSVHKNEARDYLLAHEPELWKLFQKEMLSQKTGDWLWRQPANPEWPRDLGYAIGARIARSYRDNATDEHAAMKDIMAIRDYPAFVKRSEYDP